MTLRDRLIAAWNALLGRPLTKGQVILCAHTLGMHKAIVPECDHCFDDALRSYLSICMDILIDTDRRHECLSFIAHLHCVTSRLDATNRFATINESPAYTIAAYLGIEQTAEAFDELLAATTNVMQNRTTG